ncbi:MAG: dipicolinate synthase subunit B [Clostridia bacterium]|nr:dipicolinate synthase subunit B [Clostridia bacterium]
MIVYAFCGSFCTVARSTAVMRTLCEAGEEILPVMSEITYATDTRFGTAKEVRERIEAVAGRAVLHSVEACEPIGPKICPELVVVAPCTGNTLAKLANGITDSAVTMAVKSQLRSDRPVLLALATNDGLSANLVNIGKLLCRKNVYFVPLVQDDPKNKPHSLVADFEKIPYCIEEVRKGRQVRPLFE